MAQKYFLSFQVNRKIPSPAEMGSSIIANEQELEVSEFFEACRVSISKMRDCEVGEVAITGFNKV